MSGRYQQAGQLDEQSYGDNDRSFSGVNMRLDAMALPEGVVSKAVNMQFTQGMAETRPAFMTRPWSRQLGVNFNINFPFSFTLDVGFGKVWGATTFSDPNGEERQILACSTRSWSLSAHAPATVILYPPDVDIDAPVTFTQAFQVLIMWRGKDKNPLKMDTALDFTREPVWEEVPDETNDDYTSTIPDAERGLHYGNRVWVPSGNSEVAYSDILAYTRYDAELSTLWVNEGESDILMSLACYGENAIVAFKNRSIYYLVGVLPDPSVTARLQLLTTQRGLVAPDTVVQVGKDLWFLSDDGVYAISQVLENSLQAGSDPVSAPMDPLIKQVNWGVAHKAQALYHDSKFYLALPVSERFNNVILVYDLINQAWAGWWEGPFIDVAYFLRIDVAGHRQLAFVSGDAIVGNVGKLYVLTEGYADESFGAEADIQAEMVSRGYHCGLPIDKIFLAAGLELQTWDGAGKIDVVRDGVNEEALVLSYVKDRLKYNLFAKRNYDPTNAGDDFYAPFRQDYSVRLIPSTAGSVINFDAAGTPLAGTDIATGATMPITIGNLVDGYILAGVVMFDAAANIGGMTFDGQPMTLLDNFVDFGKRVVLYGRAVGIKVAGTYSVAITVTGAAGIDYFIGNVVAYQGINQTDSIGLPAHAVNWADRAPTVEVTSAPGERVVGLTYCDDPIEPGPDQTSRWSYNGPEGAAMFSDEPGEASVTHSYSFATGAVGWIISAVPLRPAIPTSGGLNLGSGIALGMHQASSERMRIRHDTRYAQLRVRGTRGRVQVRAVSIAAHADFLPLRSTI